MDNYKVTTTISARYRIRIMAVNIMEIRMDFGMYGAREQARYSENFTHVFPVFEKIIFINN